MGLPLSEDTTSESVFPIQLVQFHRLAADFDVGLQNSGIRIEIIYLRLSFFRRPTRTVNKINNYAYPRVHTSMLVGFTLGIFSAYQI